ncbi:dipeptidase [Microbulbifer taiwanensis]|uniref:Dipeptidase n=1 Tax=Microbulbifer taiwanensis TaxID=986746 RepID=A0ABW1YHF4_9GAMM|nr:membrane dipeptidase [Microbulbifer taiwanensis]
MDSNNKTDKNISRRSFLRSGLTAAIAAPMLNFGAFKVFAASEKRYSGKVIELVNGTQVFDMLSLINPLGNMIAAGVSDKPKLMDGHKISEEYLSFLLASGTDVFHPAIDVRAEQGLAFVARLNALVAEHPNSLQRIDAIEDLSRLKKGERVGFIVGTQNSDHFTELDDINHFYTLGQRISQLTYNSRNLIGTGSTDRSDGGLSDYGVQVVERMNRVGMAVDVSHCGDTTTLDAFEVSQKPVLITHSNVRALAGGHVRCKPDEAIQAMARSGSVMGITGVRQFVSDKEPTNVEHIVDHIDYVAKLVGVEHAGIGSDMDMDGYDDIPEPYLSAIRANYKDSYAFREKLDTDGFDHPKRIFDLTDAMVRRGYSDGDIRLILGGNFKRVLGEIWHSESDR